MSEIIGLGLSADPFESVNSSVLRPSRIGPTADGNANARPPFSHSRLAMQGLLLAETGSGMVQHDLSQSDGSHFKEGQAILADTMSPSYQHLALRDEKENAEPSSNLSRHGTLLTAGVSSARNAGELKRILGNNHNRLKPNTTLGNDNRDDSIYDVDNAETTALEHSKVRARVEVDVWLDNNICVQGGFLNGHAKIRVRPRTRKECSVMLTGGKLRVIGFETIQNHRARHIFYQQSAPLSTVATSTSTYTTSETDEEGFHRAKDGIHTVTFSMPLPTSAEMGYAKGTVGFSGVDIRYIVIFSLKVKETETNRRSVAHFYRDCEIWPRLNPSSILAPASKPIMRTATEGLRLGGPGDLSIEASLHRLCWIAGQPCFVHVVIRNETKKTMKTLTLTLLRTTTVFKPKPVLDADMDTEDPNACQTTTTTKVIAQSTLEMGQPGTRGHASARGWWPGVRPSESHAVNHCFNIPMQSLTISRSRLVEIQYTVRVSVDPGPLLSNVEVELPIHIVNFLSVDPPPTAPQDNSSRFRTNTFDPGENTSRNPSQVVTELVDPPQEEVPRQIRPPWDADVVPMMNDLSNLAIPDDTDEVIHQAVSSASIDSRYAQHAGRFSDLYYSAIPSVPSRSNMSANVYEATMETRAPMTKAQSYISTPLKSTIASSTDSTPHNKTPKTPNRFPERVEQKLREASKDGRLGHKLEDSFSSRSSLSSTPEESDYRSSSHMSSSTSHGSYFRARGDMPDTVERDPTPNPQPPMLSLPSSRSSSSFSRSEYFDSVPASRTSSQTSVESNGKRSLDTHSVSSLQSQVVPARVGGQIYGACHREEFSLPTTRQVRPRSRTSEYSNKEYTTSSAVRARSWTTTREKDESLLKAASDSPPIGSAFSVRERIRMLEVQARSVR